MPSVIYRRLAAAHSIYPERLPLPHRCAVRRLARAQAPRRRGLRCAKLRRSRAFTPSWPRPPPVGAPCCAMSQHVCRHASRKNNSPAGHGWPDPVVQAARVTRQKTPRTGASASVKGSGKGTFFLVRSPRVRLGVRLQRAVPAAPPGAGASPRLVDRHIVLLRCCILLLYQGLELRAQDFEFISLTWV